MRIAIVPHADRPRSLELAHDLMAAARQQGIDMVASEHDAAALDMDTTDLNAEAGVDLVVAIGGDGTVLKAVRVGLRTGAPVYGINDGHLGFLADGEPRDLGRTVKRLLEEEWFTSDRMMIQASIDGGDPVAGLNDVVIEKVESQRTVRLAVGIDGEHFITYAADGLVVATPTGSTAYNLSAGGPLVDPELDAIVMTPVAAHSLFSRALVFPPERTLEVRGMEDRPVGVNVDGIDVGPVHPGGVITITRSEKRITFVSLSGRSFPATLEQKFSLE